MITVSSADHRLQHGHAELIDGQLRPPVECPERAERILSSVREAALGEVVAPQAFGLAPIVRVHDTAFVDFLAGAHERWLEQHGPGDALPLVWPTRGFRQQLPEHPEHIDGQLGYYSFDAATPITAGTWRAARSAVNVALTGQQLIAGGERAVFALCRPPGHHAARDLYGGYCFLNNAAIAAQAFVDGGARVVLLDIDYHHGNGSQSIFYATDDVLFVSLHVDPRHDYPYFLGYADEQGEGRGAGYTLNLPLPPGTAWDTYQAALWVVLERIAAYAPDVLVVSLGVDTFVGDPICHFNLSQEDFVALGSGLADANLPTLFVLEGGYNLDAIGTSVVNTLCGFLGRRV